LTITVNNGNNPVYAADFDDLIKEVFGFSFEPWIARGLWDERYESYSIIENGKMLANVCIFKTDMIICGKPTRAHQFGAVATRASERGKGLSRLLMNHVLDKYPDTLAFLAANPSVTGFYPNFGFMPIQTYRPIMDVEINNPTERAQKCSPEDEILRKALYGKRIYSNLVDSVNTQPIQLFHFIMNEDYENSIYFLPGCGAIVVATQIDCTLLLSDVISAKPLTFDQLIKELPFSGVKRVEFGFCPDWLGIAPRWKALDEPYFIRGSWNLPEYFRFPALSET